MGDRLLETRLGEQVRVWTLGGDRLESSYGANCIGIAGRDSVLLVDPLIAPAHSRLVGDAVRAWTDVPVRFVVLTHHHTDHALGASWFAARGATVVAHRACRAAMETEHPALIESRRKVPTLAELFRDAVPYVPAKLTILQDGLTASGAELIIAALTAYAPLRAQTLGTRTYGKGVAQDSIMLKQ
ncbi:MAG: MBL fold metallo-hydrolase, partial [Acidobacteriota bacterium]